MLATDVSNYQPADLSDLVAQYPDVRHICVRLSTETNRNQRAIAVAQLRWATAHGYETSGYIWAYWGLNPRDHISDALSVAAEAGVDLAFAAIDVEDSDVASPEACIPWLRTAIEELVLAGVEPIIYSAPDFWQTYLNDTTEFSDIGLWGAQPDGIATLESLVTYGGMRAVGKQYVMSPIDLDVFALPA
ncbi:MAG: GH25 family lysozyme [Dehalococcoidales bacterium]|nr:GH25 family lysozyme [Dehalococcoidales bacterium]